MNTIKYKDGNTWKEYPTIVSTNITDQITLYEYGKLCILDIKLHKTSNTACGVGVQTIGTLPSRIKINSAAFAGGRGSITSGTIYPMMLEVTDDNRILVNNNGSGAVSLADVHGQIVFINYGS